MNNCHLSLEETLQFGGLIVKWEYLGGGVVPFDCYERKYAGVTKNVVFLIAKQERVIRVPSYHIKVTSGGIKVAGYVVRKGEEHYSQAEKLYEIAKENVMCQKEHEGRVALTRVRSILART